jgi:UDP-N-acetylmuramoyl-L-alanyl-D-glutamate--2,6-diaminopimelate ligase
MTVHELLQALAGAMPQHDRLEVTGNASALDVPCAGVTHDSRRVQPGMVFVALHGRAADGVAFAPQAVDAGAAAIVSDRPPAGASAVPWVHVDDARLALALLAAEFFHHPSREIKVVGITGTNGKTTTSYLVAAMFEAAGIRCGLMGTVEYRIGDRTSSATRTTPEASEVQASIREMVEAGCGACAMEVSSHALALRRIDGMRFAAAVFTNLTRDHLDFHGGMEEYFAAKRRLFEMLPLDAPAIVNVDDPRAAALAHITTRPVTYGINRIADVSPGPLSISLQGLEFDIRLPQGSVRVRSKLAGRPNAYNILAAAATAAALGVPLEAIERGIERVEGVPGRFERVSSEADDITVVVDYAHTDDALRNLLETARAMSARKLITVFGAGGDRDRTKRPLMGMVAARLSDVVVITSDNPRSEDPARIIDEVKRGTTAETRLGRAEVVTITDRRDAIVEAISRAAPEDVVLIAGKGHEKYQEVAGNIAPFDDGAVAREALQARRLKARVG